MWLEQDGVRARAVFRFMFEHKPDAMEGFVDSCLSEVAAYELARLMQLDNVPPTVVRKIAGKRGSLQLWVENVTPLGKWQLAKGHVAADDPTLETQMASLAVFDNLIANLDRNSGNVLIGEGDVFWWIDHTRSFGGLEELKYPEKLSICPRSLWQKLERLSESEVRERLRPYSRRYVGALFVRLELLKSHFEDEIHRRGEDEVLVDDGPSELATGD